MATPGAANCAFVMKPFHKGFIDYILVDPAGIWTLQGVTIATNAASIAVQQSCGFRMVGRRERIGKRDGAWHDTVILERRSATVGVD